MSTAAGPRGRATRRVAAGCVGAALWLSSGCGAPAVRPSLQSDQTRRVIPALVTEGGGSDAAADPTLRRELVRRLDDPDPAVRAVAAERLYRLTGRRFGYRYYRDAAGRRAAVDRWAAWRDGAPPADTSAAGLTAARRAGLIDAALRGPQPSGDGPADDAADPASRAGP